MIGLIGIGNIGMAVAEALLRASYCVVGFSKTNMPAFAALGGTAATSPMAVAQSAAIILCCLPDEDAARDVYEGESNLISGLGAGTIVIDASSVDTKNKTRDKHLRSGDFFEVDTHPTIIYTATGASPVGDTFKVSGDLTVHGQTRPLEVMATGTDDGAGRVRITAEVDIDRSQWGLTWAKMGARLANHVVVNAEFTKA